MLRYEDAHRTALGCGCKLGRKYNHGKSLRLLTTLPNNSMNFASLSVMKFNSSLRSPSF